VLSVCVVAACAYPDTPHVHADVGVAIESTTAVLIRHPRWISLAHCSTVRHTHSHPGVPLFFHTPPTHQHSNRPPLHSSLSAHIAFSVCGVCILACLRACRSRTLSAACELPSVFHGCTHHGGVLSGFFLWTVVVMLHMSLTPNYPSPHFFLSHPPPPSDSFLQHSRTARPPRPRGSDILQALLTSCARVKVSCLCRICPLSFPPPPQAPAATATAATPTRTPTYPSVQCQATHHLHRR
jgi:hypothetical protein